MPEAFDFVVVGGGAAGFFGAISFARSRPGSRVVILEKTGSVLGKVRISGGGRCNVTHACFEPRVLTKNYPRGGKSLIGAFHRWSASDTVDWFENHGVKLKTESDGRMFPVTDSSETIIDCLLGEAEKAGVEVVLRTGVDTITRGEDKFFLKLSDESQLQARSILLATGGVRNGSGQRLAGEMGHEIITAAPSLFTFNIEDERLDQLAGVSVNPVKAFIPGTSLKSTGPCLITHWGLSGPAILKLSAWGARELAEHEYRFDVTVDWSNGRGIEAINELLLANCVASPKKQVGSGVDGLSIPVRLWQRLVKAAGIGEVTWANLSKLSRRALVNQLTASAFAVNGKSMNKEEFVTAGGVNLKEVNFKTMESRIIPGLYFAGEVLDIDGVTGGFNFQAAWTTSKIAGESAAALAE
ncbi:MAG: NAD(P)/FAD-dependent oxidoreductase [Verrucomicrobiales bacterium]|nr:NAD(P)/FAD-dependent oxidoreductase [Verrucomicrobiales bacterium]